MEIRTCKKCGFILGTRPGLKEVDGVCLACINQEAKKTIDFESRKKWLTDYIQQNITNDTYECVVAVSGGKDSHCIVRRLIENHGIKNPLLVNVTDEFTHTKAGQYNIDNLVKRYNLDLITFRLSPQTNINEAKKGFFETLHPLKWMEARINDIPIQVAESFGIKLVFYGENSAFEYGESTELDIFHPNSTEKTNVIFLGAIYPYSIMDSLESAREIGFRDLDFYNEWQRQGTIENYAQIDSIGYLIQIWTKFVKFGFSRVSDIACRLVRDGILTKEQAEALIKERDYICDPAAKRDFCNTIGISEKEFDDTVDKFANRDIVIKDVNGQWRRKDLI